MFIALELICSNLNIELLQFYYSTESGAVLRMAGGDRWAPKGRLLGAALLQAAGHRLLPPKSAWQNRKGGAGISWRTVCRASSHESGCLARHSG